MCAGAVLLGHDACSPARDTTVAVAPWPGVVPARRRPGVFANLDLGAEPVHCALEWHRFRQWRHRWLPLRFEPRHEPLLLGQQLFLLLLDPLPLFSQLLRLGHHACSSKRIPIRWLRLTPSQQVFSSETPTFELEVCSSPHFRRPRPRAPLRSRGPAPGRGGPSSGRRRRSSSGHGRPSPRRAGPRPRPRPPVMQTTAATAAPAPSGSAATASWRGPASPSPNEGAVAAVPGVGSPAGAVHRRPGALTHLRRLHLGDAGVQP